MKVRWLARFGMLPSSNILVMIVVTLGFPCLSGSVLNFLISLGELVLSAEMAAAGLFAGKGVVAEDFSELDEVGHPPGFFEFGIEAAS